MWRQRCKTIKEEAFVNGLSLTLLTLALYLMEQSVSLSTIINKITIINPVKMNTHSSISYLFETNLSRKKQAEDLQLFLEELKYGDVLGSPTKLEIPDIPLVDVDTIVLQDDEEWKERLRYEGVMAL